MIFPIVHAENKKDTALAPAPVDFMTATCRRLILGLAFFVAFDGGADVRVPAIFSDHLVLQRAERVPVWGWADPGEQVTVALGSAAAATATTDADGKWRAWLNLSAAEPGPFELVIRGANELRITDVVIGEVWLASGQSNMEWILGGSLGAAEEVARPENRLLRQFLVPKRPERLPVDDIQGRWVVAGPTTVKGFTGVGYYFGQALQRELKAPVGIINASYGAANAETWTSQPAIDSHPDLKAGRIRVEDAFENHPDRVREFAVAYRQWQKQNDREDRRAQPGGTLPDLSSAETLTVKLPGSVPQAPGPGAIWFRRSIDCGPTPPTSPLKLELGTVVGFEEVYWNGALISSTTPENHPGTGAIIRHEIAPNLVRPGVNELAIRVFAVESTPAIRTAPERLRLGTIPIAGEWDAIRESTLPALNPSNPPPTPPKTAPAIQTVASRLFNGMIHPLAPFAIAGVIWYQGESNTSRSAQYQTTFPLLINDWRQLWQRDDLPFYWCQLAAYRPRQPATAPSPWAELRDAQTRTLLLPHTGQAITIDVGETGDIHPRNKQTPGTRLAAVALAKTYERPVPFAGPTFQSARIDGDRVHVTFASADGLRALPFPAEEIITSIPPKSAPLVRNVPDSELEGFALCGEDGVWHWADAHVEGETVIVSSTEVPQPRFVRYAWSDNPIVNLVNAHGFPAEPFRTDNQPLSTATASF